MRTGEEFARESQLDGKLLSSYMDPQSIDRDVRLSSPNRLVWEYFSALRRAVQRTIDEEHKHSKQQEVAVCIFLAVTAVETFLNVYFRTLVEEEPYSPHKSRFLHELKSRISLERKLSKWPTEILGRGLLLTEGPGKAFNDLRDLRNDLMHFTSSHQTLDLPGVTIHGLADTTSYDNLGDEQAKSALRVAENLVAELFILRGIPYHQVCHLLHAWTGKVPI